MASFTPSSSSSLSGSEAAKSQSGYECTFLSEVPDALTCIICLFPARNPHQISCCGRVFCKFSLDKHKSTSGATCPNCRKRDGTGFHDIRGERHLLSCRVKCIYSDCGCSWEGELKAMEEHTKTCSGEIVPCPYAAVGCNAQLFKKQIEKHKSSVDHLEMAVKKISLLSEKLKPKPEVNIPPVVFKIKDFDDHREFDTVWDSPPFYTHPKGYKLYLKVYPSGTGGYEEEYLSIIVCLMHGEHDDNLVWPFRGVVSFEVLKQDSDSDHKEGTARFMEKKSSQKNRRVSAAEGKRDIGWGSLKMIPLDDEVNFLADETIDDFVGDSDCLYVRVSQVTVSEQNKPWLI